MNKDYIDGLKEAIKILDLSLDIDNIEMEGMPEMLKGAERSNSQAKQLIQDEIDMQSSVIAQSFKV